MEIDEALCDGCGQCVPSCAEGAIAVVDGKARLSADVLCDGLGACIGECPRGAIAVIEREAPAFDEAAVAARRGHAPPRPRPRLSIVPDVPAAADDGAPGGGCPGTRSTVIPRRPLAVVAAAAAGGAPAGGDAEGESRLSHWPVQLHLVNPAAPWLRGADLLVAADCVPFAYARFHDELLAGRAVVVGCPKLDDLSAYEAKLAAIFRAGAPRAVTVARMEVPCCGGISAATRRALAAAGSAAPFREVVVGVNGAPRG